MVLFALLALFAGILCGITGAGSIAVQFLTSHVDGILCLLMFLVGISVGLHRGLAAKLRQYHIRIFIIPAGVVAGSLAGGMICGLITTFSMGESTAVACGLGWYSLTGVTLGNLAGAQVGSIAFLSNLMREIFSFFSIPFLSKKLNYYSCIASAGATSEDTTLPMMIKYTDEETVVLSVINGVICSALVPVLVSLCYQMF